MNILVCVSRVPDTAARISLSKDVKSIDENGIKFILNPYDEFALETGIRLKEEKGGELTAICVGPESSQEILRTALAMGADKATLVKYDEGNSDAFVIAENIAAVAKELNPDIIITGRQSIDFDSYSKSSMVAAILDLPSVSIVSKLDINGNSVICERDIEGGKETLETELPCVISVQKGIYEPRYPKLPDIMKAKKKEITIIDAKFTETKSEVLSIEIPQSSRVGKILGDSDSDISDIVTSLHNDAKVI